MGPDNDIFVFIKQGRQPLQKEIAYAYNIDKGKARKNHEFRKPDASYSKRNGSY